MTRAERRRLERIRFTQMAKGLGRAQPGMKRRQRRDYIREMGLHKMAEDEKVLA